LEWYKYLGSLTKNGARGFISLVTPFDRQGANLVLMQSVGSVARISGPIMGGSLTQFRSIQNSFYVGGLAHAVICASVRARQ
jgi:hypothetical protein